VQAVQTLGVVMLPALLTLVPGGQVTKAVHAAALLASE